ncbi:Thymidylate kinase [Diatrype stigma]|uniref:Thymidylate kinase n=1 Tax=Diatrype stigma TaxID=117547 RepID=A0AAN9UET4_9PEZI
MEVDSEPAPAATLSSAHFDKEVGGAGGDSDANGATVILEAPQISSSPARGGTRIEIPTTATAAVEEGGGGGGGGEKEGDRDRKASSPHPPSTDAAAAAIATAQSPITVDGMDGVEETGPGVVPPAPTTPGPAPAVAPAAATTPLSGGSSMEGVGSTSTSTKVVANNQKPVRGAFIVFEGMDRAGKTTQAKLLQVRCVESGRDVRFMRFPDRSTPIGQMIDSYLKGQSEIEDHVIHLLFSANRWEAANKIKSDLAAGRTVVCDRFYHSGIVYSAAKQNRTLSLSWAKAPEVGLPRPDVVLFLDLDEEVARRRGGWGGEVYEKGEMQRRVRELFWGLSMGDLGNTVAGGGAATATGAGAGTGADASSNAAGIITSGGGSGGGGGKSLGRRDSAGVGGGRSGNGGIGAGGVGGNNGGGPGAGFGGEDGEFRQEEEDIQIVDAALGVEDLSDKVWEVVLPRLEAVERGEVGSAVRIVR